MKEDSVCIIILNWNGKEYTKDCIQSIKDNTSYENFDVVVVDNGSNDGSSKMIKEKFPEVKLIEKSRNLGFSIANNIGMYDNPGYSFYLLLNNDTKVKEDWLSEMIETVKEHESAGIVGAKLLYPDNTIQHAGGKLKGGKSVHIGEGENPDKFDSDTKREYVTGAAFLIDSEVKKEIGYLDEVFTPASYEETDYCKRAKEAGYEIFFSSDSEIIHYEGKTRENTKNEQKYLIQRKNALVYLILNGGLTDLVRKLFVEMKHLTASIIGYKYNPRKALFTAHLGILKDLPALVYKRFNRDEHVPSYYCEGSKDYSNIHILNSEQG
ncbi:MAG: glycosyltransferase family 2 protein [Candidatus Nanohaloarchaea archaeon]